MKPSLRQLARRALTAIAVAGALGNAGCANSGAPARSPAPGSSEANGPSQSGAHAQPASGGSEQSTEALIGELLAGVEPSGTPGEGAEPVATPEPQVTPSAQMDSPSPDSLDTFDDDVRRIQQAVPGWNYGTGVGLKFLKESTGTRLSLVFVDPTPPVFQDTQGLWMVQAKAFAGSKSLGYFVLLLRRLQPGTYEGSPSRRDVVMSVAVGEQWDGKDPETTWSINPGSWAEITLRNAGPPGDLEGTFRGKLVDNKGTGVHTIEMGYVYINR